MKKTVFIAPILGIIILTLIAFWVNPYNISIEKSSDISESGLKNATFAGGCFWCVESDFEKQYGVFEVISGYSGGDGENPTYEEVSSGTTGYRESVQVFYNPKIISYSELVDVFWRHVNPLDSGGQFVDRGFQYTPAIFYNNEEEKEIAEKSRELLDKSEKYELPIATSIIEFKNFYPAEEYHQDYYMKNSLKYKFYRFNSGRDLYLEEIWGREYSKPTEEEIKSKLTELQFYVTQEEGTEKPFNNEYWDNHKEGIYVDVVSGEPLFSSLDKFDSGTGWPSFTKPLEINNIVKKEDNSLLTTRTEVRSKYGDSHLGHLFYDGIEPTRIRYCMNSAALRFIPKEDLESEGYGEYSYLFE